MYVICKEFCPYYILAELAKSDRSVGVCQNGQNESGLHTGDRAEIGLVGAEYVTCKEFCLNYIHLEYLICKENGGNDIL